MKSLAVVLAVTAASLGPVQADACGDKFLRVGRGARYQRGYAALYPACILAYARPGSAVARAIRELEPALKRAGHRLLLVDDTGVLAPALKTGHYNLVLTDFSDVAAVERQARSAGPRLPIIPVLHRPTKEALAAATKEYPCVVEAPGNKSDVLERIDVLLESRAKAEGAAKKK